MFILNSDIAFSHCFPIIAVFLFKIISLSRDRRLEITRSIFYKNSVNSHKGTFQVSEVVFIGNKYYFDSHALLVILFLYLHLVSKIKPVMRKGSIG